MNFFLNQTKKEPDPRIRIRTKVPRIRNTGVSIKYFLILQVGNAVPPPMGKVLGLEIRKAMAEAEKTKRRDPKQEAAPEATAVEVSA